MRIDLWKENGPIAQFRLERTPDKREVGGSSPPRPTTLIMSGGVAQLGERLPCTQEVIGSIPFTSTIFFERGGRTESIKDCKTYKRIQDKRFVGFLVFNAGCRR